jgi:hypothetical protein
MVWCILGSTQEFGLEILAQIIFEEEMSVKVRIVFCTVALLAVCALTAVAADVSGKWVAQVPGRDGATQERVFVFQVSGATLTGTISSQRGDQPISEGKVSGDEISFVVVRKFQEREMKTTYKGKVSGNEIKFTSTTPGRDGGEGRTQEFTAKKAGA